MEPQEGNQFAGNGLSGTHRDHKGIINFSADGMLVNMVRFAMTRGAAVALAGATFHRLQSEMFRLRALIILSNDNLAGLMFIGDRHNVAVLCKDLQSNSYMSKLIFHRAK